MLYSLHVKIAVPNEEWTYGRQFDSYAGLELGQRKISQLFQFVFEEKELEGTE